MSSFDTETQHAPNPHIVMNKLLSWVSGITFAVIFTSSYLLWEGLIPVEFFPIVPLVVASLYAISIDSFWKKISNDFYTDKHFKQLIKMLIKHQKDEGTLRVILRKISSEEMTGPLHRNYIQAIEDLVKGDKKHHLFRTIRAICDLVREDSVKRFSDKVRDLTKNHALHVQNEDFINLFNEKMMRCFLEVGGYPTWGDTRDALLPIFENVSKDDAEKFLLTVEERFESHATPKSEYLQTEGARKQVFLSLRRWLMEREPTLA